MYNTNFSSISSHRKELIKNAQVFEQTSRDRIVIYFDFLTYFGSMRSKEVGNVQKLPPIARENGVFVNFSKYVD